MPKGKTPDVTPELDNSRVELTADEREMLVPSLLRVAAMQEKIQDILGTLQPVLNKVAKDHGVEADKYALSPDCRFLVRREQE